MISFSPPDSAERPELLDWIQNVPLVTGPWRGFKGLFKTSEAAYINGERDAPVLAAILARLDAQTLSSTTPDNGVLLPGNFSAWHVEAHLVYAATNKGTVETYDFSDLLAPRMVGTLKLKDDAFYTPRFKRDGAHLWLQANSDFWALDLENPSNPRLLGHLDSKTNASAVAGDLVVAFGRPDLRVWNLQNGAFTEVGRVTLDANVYPYIASGGVGVATMLVYGSRNYRLHFFDLSNPAAPRARGQLSVDYASETRFIGQTMWTIANNKLRAIDVSNLDAPREVGAIKADSYRALALDAKRAVLVSQDYTRDPQTGNYSTSSSLKIVDISRPSDLRLIGESSINAPDTPLLIGDTLLLAGTKGVRALDLSESARSQPLGQNPSRETFAYLKRRGRRLLRTLDEADERGFVDLASAFFAANAGREFDFPSNWIATDLLLAHHPGWRQTSHGRGPYLREPSLVRTRRVERGVEIWNRNPETLRPFAIQPDAPAPVVSLARAVLKFNNETPAPLSPAQIESYVWAIEPTLRIEGARAALSVVGDSSTKAETTSSSTNALSPRAIAGALWASSARRRRLILENVAPNAQIATHLATLLGRDLPVERNRVGVRFKSANLSRRGREIALLLAARFDLSDTEFRADGGLDALPALLGSGEAPLRALGTHFCRRLNPQSTLGVVALAANNPAALDALCESAARADFELKLIQKALDSSNVVRDAVWKLVAASQTSRETLQLLWVSLFAGLSGKYSYSGRTSNYSWTVSPRLENAIGNSDALETLARAQIDARLVRPGWQRNMVGLKSPGDYSQYQYVAAPPQVFGAYALFIAASLVVDVFVDAPNNETWPALKTAWLRAVAPHSEVVARFWEAVQTRLSSTSLDEKSKSLLRARTFGDAEVAATFAGAASKLPPSFLLDLIASVPDQVWNGWRPALLQTLQTDAIRREAFWDAARTSGFEGQLRTRLVDDAEFAATFGLLESDVLEFDDPALETLILAWLRARELPLGELSRAATHPLEQVRDFGLEQLQARGLNVPIALKLLESRLRAPMDFAKNWFESQNANAVDLALALCDSPKLDARIYGREFVEKRLDFLLENGLLARLEENPNADTQGFVAELLTRKPESEPTEFDRAVLRSRHRARRAKSLVQARRASSTPLPDDATLLELARGKTPRDAEWALSQLARRALENKVEGVEVSGVATI